MNPDLQKLQPYPFQKLAALFREVQPNPAYRPISLSIGEPKHATPQFIRDAVTANLDGLANYPTTAGSDALRSTISGWLTARYDIPAPDAKTQILPVNGSREALFAFAQAVIDRSKNDPAVVCPNPFYQIYEGAAFLAGATPYFLNTLPEDNYALNFAQLSEEVWQRTQLIYVCSPGNPTGRVMPLEEWQTLFEMSDRYGFVIASDECYSEIYFENRKPLSALQAARQLGRNDYKNLVVFSSLSKRSNVPGMRSGFVAGDADVIAKFTLYRTYHGSAMNPAIQAASIAAWNDEAHVAENRRLYAEKFAQVAEILKPVLPVTLPDASFYLWVRTPISDTAFAQALYRDYNVTVLPGSYLARSANGVNPGENFVRLALVANTEETVEAAQRIRHFVEQLVAGSPPGFATSHQPPATSFFSSNRNPAMQDLQNIIDLAFERRAEITPRNAESQLKEAVDAVITQLDQGKLRVAEKIDGQWVTHQWLKKAVLLSFRLEDNAFIKGGFTNYYDKVPSKFADYNSRDFREGGFRVVPPAAARKGAYIAKNVVLMPSYVNIGAYVDEGTMVDTWATVGSCAQIGKNVHLSGGVGIGGVLEPVQANPTIIGDNCFVGARSEIVEGVILEDNVVISMGVFIGQSTKIYDRETGEITYGRVPAGSVVVSGSLPSADGKYSLYCAVIVKKVDEKTRSKVGINELLRGI